MDPRIQAWIDRREFRVAKIAELDREVETLLAAAKEASFPEHVRPAVKSDIVVGAVLWHKAQKCGAWWELVATKLYISDLWQSYRTNYGERHGIDGAFVEVEDDEVYEFDSSLYRELPMLVRRDRETGALKRTPAGEAHRKKAAPSHTKSFVEVEDE